MRKGDNVLTFCVPRHPFSGDHGAETGRGLYLGRADLEPVLEPFERYFESALIARNLVEFQQAVESWRSRVSSCSRDAGSRRLTDSMSPLQRNPVVSVFLEESTLVCPAHLPVFPAFGIDYAAVSEGHEELPGLILDVDQAGYQVVDVLDRGDLGRVHVSERHGAGR